MGLDRDRIRDPWICSQTASVASHGDLATRPGIESVHNLYIPVVVTTKFEPSYVFTKNFYRLILSSKHLRKGSYMVMEIYMGVLSPRLEFEYIMFISFLGYDFYIYGAFEFLCNSIANL